MVANHHKLLQYRADYEALGLDSREMSASGADFTMGAATQLLRQAGRHDLTKGLRSAVCRRHVEAHSCSHGVWGVFSFARAKRCAIHSLTVTDPLAPTASSCREVSPGGPGVRVSGSVKAKTDFVEEGWRRSMVSRRGSRNVGKASRRLAIARARAPRASRAASGGADRLRYARRNMIVLLSLSQARAPCAGRGVACAALRDAQVAAGRGRT